MFRIPDFKSRIIILLSLMCITLIGLLIKVIYIDYSFNREELKFVNVLDSNDFVYEKDGKKWIYGGNGATEKDFDITTFSLNTKQLHYGIGREYFPALIEPEFITSDQIDGWLHEKDNVLAVKVGEEVKVYPIKLLLQHEIVNDVVGGKPIFTAYCYLADLGAVYSRDYNGQTLTFGLSGYTYFDEQIWDGRDAFVFWDRETESLWWPPIGKAVSGELNDVPLKLLQLDYWSQTTWSEVLRKYPQALVLKPGQGMVPPKEWNHLNQETVALVKKIPEENLSIAPRWGENNGSVMGLELDDQDTTSIPAGSGAFR